MKTNFKYSHFTTNEIKPSGWLRRQLEIQAAGLSGNLDKIWPDVRDSAWIGGDREGWERVPYWLDGFIPLAYLLDDEDLKSRAGKYINAILERQEEDGWICPCPPDRRTNYDTWAVFLICKVLTVYYECTGDERAMTAMYNALKNLKAHITRRTLFNWGQARWFEGLISIYAVYKKYPEKWLEELAVTLASQGFDWRRLFAKYPDTEPKREWCYQTHIVNLMMALKGEALYSPISGDEPNAFAEKMLEILYKYHGSPIGFINGDECLAGKAAINGAELCSIVEAMYSFEILFEITGNPVWAEKLETYAFNFLPATVSDDMWTHQYLQQVNQISCADQNEPPVYFTNTAEANRFGLEPHFGCCTSNFNQGWPKFILSTFMENEDGFISVVPVPSVLETAKNGAKVKITVNTDYPFSNTAKYTVSVSDKTRFKLEIRIPESESALVNGEKAEGIYVIDKTWEGDEEITLTLNMKTELIKTTDDFFYLKRGCLIFAAPLAENREMLEYEKKGVERKFPYCDYLITPAEDWGLAFTDKFYDATYNGIGNFPFSRTEPAITIEAEMAVIDWGSEEGQPNVCRRTPKDTTPKGYVKRKFVPYGATTLRMTAMPKIK